MKTSQLSKPKDGVNFDYIIAAAGQEGISSSSVNADRPPSPVPPAPPAVVPTDNDSNKQIDDFSNDKDLSTPSTCHKAKFKQALEEIKCHVGEVYSVRNSKKEEIKWKVITDHVVVDLPHICLTSCLGIKDVSLLRDIKSTRIPLAILYMLLAYVDREWERPLVQMNKKIEMYNNYHSRKNRKFRAISQFTEREFIIAHAIVIGAADCSDRGEQLWGGDKSKGQSDEDFEKYWNSISPRPDFTELMKLYRFKQFRQFFPMIWESDHHAGKDPWWKFQSAIDNFNYICKTLLLPSEILCVDESMSAFRLQTTKTGNLPNISFVARKPENLGTEFKTCSCPVTGILSFLEIQRGKGQMNNHKYYGTIGATASCALRMSEG